jgi:diamine N-acetyltransferase
MSSEVTLREVTAATVRSICDLDVAPNQKSFVAPNSVSIAQAHFEPNAWFRAIYAGDEPVGFVMLEANEDKVEYFLWRLMIASGHQRKGYGQRAVQLLIEHVRTLPGATTLLTSYVPGEAGPQKFYESLGFEATGEVDDGEIVCGRSLETASGD